MLYEYGQWQTVSVAGSLVQLFSYVSDLNVSVGVCRESLLGSGHYVYVPSDESNAKEHVAMVSISCIRSAQ